MRDIICNLASSVFLRSFARNSYFKIHQDVSFCYDGMILIIVVFAVLVKFSPNWTDSHLTNAWNTCLGIPIFNDWHHRFICFIIQFCCTSRWDEKDLWVCTCFHAYSLLLFMLFIYLVTYMPSCVFLLII